MLASRGNTTWVCDVCGTRLANVFPSDTLLVACNQTDLYGVASCVHELLFHAPLELQTIDRADGSKHYRPASRLRRCVCARACVELVPLQQLACHSQPAARRSYWSTLIWSELFEALLNVRDCTVPSRELASLKAQLARELRERFSRHGLRLQTCCRALVAGLKASHRRKPPAVARKRRQSNKWQ